MTAGTGKAYFSKSVHEVMPGKRDRRLTRHGDQQPERLGDLRERIQANQPIPAVIVFSTLGAR